jgi:hypothetical protein
VVALSLLVLTVYPAKLDIRQTGSLAQFAGFFGIGLSFCSPLLKLYLTSVTRTEICDYRRCLLILGQAQSRINELKARDSGKSTATEPPSGQPRFMAKLRSIGTIDLPFDFDHDSHTLISREHGDQGEKSNLH